MVLRAINVCCIIIFSLIVLLESVRTGAATSSVSTNSEPGKLRPSSNSGPKKLVIKRTRSSMQELAKVAAEAAGVFRSNATQQVRLELKNVVIVTAANIAYKAHLQNFACWLNRLSMKSLVFSLDSEMHAYVDRVVQKDPKTPTLYSYEWTTGISSTANWRTPEFHAISTAKLEVVLAMLRLQYDVLFVDPDVALMRDPFPYLLWQNVDMAYSMNAICPHSDAYDAFAPQKKESGNTGFYFARASNSTINLFRLVISEAARFPNLDDQSIFWAVLRNEDGLLKKGSLRAVDLGYCHDFHHSGLVRSRRRPGQQNITIPYVDTKAPQFKGASSQDFLKTGLFVEYANSTSGSAPEFVMCPLDGCMFSAGGLRGVSYGMLEVGLSWRHEEPVSVHANYMIGTNAKIAALKRHGLWLASSQGDDSFTCTPYSRIYCRQSPQLCLSRPGDLNAHKNQQ